MRSIPWRREATIERLRRDVWLYLTQAAQSEEDILLNAAALLQMPPGEVRFLAQLQFILSEAVGQLLEQMPSLVRRLTTTTAVEVETSAERIRGAIRWSETFSQRAVAGASHVYVTAPTRRAYDTPENEVLVFALHAIAAFGKRTGWHTSATPGPAQVVRDRVAAATRWLQARALADLTVRPPSPKTLARVRVSRSRRRYQAALDVVELYQHYIARLDRGALREAIENFGLVTNRDDVLLELLCAFETMRILRELGWQAPPARLLNTSLIFRGTRQGNTIRLYYQVPPPELDFDSRYGAAQAAHGFPSTSRLSPDLVVRTDGPAGRRWLVIEVKGGPKRTLEASARAATYDLLAYRRAFETSLRHQTGMYGLGYVWGAELEPSLDGEIRLCTPDTLQDALAAFFAPSQETDLAGALAG